MQVCDAMYFRNPRCESRDFRASDWTKAGDLCSAMCVAENHLCDAMHFPAICALTAEIHCDVDHDASITAIAMPRCGELRHKRGAVQIRVGLELAESLRGPLSGPFVLESWSQNAPLRGLPAPLRGPLSET